MRVRRLAPPVLSPNRTSQSERFAAGGQPPFAMGTIRPSWCYRMAVSIRPFDSVPEELTRPCSDHINSASACTLRAFLRLRLNTISPVESGIPQLTGPRVAKVSFRNGRARRKMGVLGWSRKTLTAYGVCKKHPLKLRTLLLIALRRKQLEGSEKHSRYVLCVTLSMRPMRRRGRCAREEPSGRSMVHRKNHS